MSETRLCWSEGCPAVGSAVVFGSLPFVVRLVLARVALLLASGDRRDAEILALRHQLLVLPRQVPRPSFDDTDRTVLGVLSLWVPETHPRRSDTIAPWSRRRRLLWSGTCRRARRSSGRADVAAEHADDGLAAVNLRLRDLASPSPAVMGSHPAAAAPQTTAVEIRFGGRASTRSSNVCNSRQR